MKTKKFQFQLEALLKIRNIQEEKALQELGKIQSKINKAIAEVQTLEKQYQKEIQRFNEYSKSQNILNYQNFILFLNRLQNTKNRVQKYIQSLQPELEEKRKKVLEARKNKRILEILKEKRLEEYKKELKKLEQKEIFEFNQKNSPKEYEVLETYSPEIPDEEPKESTEEIRARKQGKYTDLYKRKDYR
ncbi:MAG: flagellar export protein FliJ [Leptonema sp. (in: bacteria)]